MLDLGHNFLNDEAIEVIARGLEKNRVLTTLILQGNGIGEKVWLTRCRSRGLPEVGRRRTGGLSCVNLIFYFVDLAVGEGGGGGA